MYFNSLFISCYHFDYIDMFIFVSKKLIICNLPVRDRSRLGEFSLPIRSDLNTIIRIQLN